jgi:hypothetical protein
MVLSKRERYVLIATLIAVGALALDQFAISPLLARRSQTEADRARLTAELKRSQSLIALRGVLGPRWQEMTRSGLKSDPAEAETQILRAMRDWAEASGVALSLLKPDRLTEKSRLPEIAFQAAGTGNLDSLRKFLLQIQGASIPIKVTETQVSARKEGMDDLSFQLHISTIYTPARPAQAAATTAQSGGNGGR